MIIAELYVWGVLIIKTIPMTQEQFSKRKTKWIYLYGKLATVKAYSANS